MNQKIREFFVKRAIAIIILMLAGLVGYFIFQKYQISRIDSFAKCAAAGYPIMESYPEQCRANGKTFVNR